MKRIIANINMFDFKQPIFVYQDGNKINAAEVRIEQAAAAIKDFIEKYNDSEIILQGAKVYINRIRRELKERYDISIG